MSRRLIVLAVAVVVIAAVALAYVFRGELTSAARSAPAPAATRTSNVEPNGASSPPTEVPRGDVAIDARRQQLIGVRTAPAQRTQVATTVRTTGIVRYDETRQVDANVKLDGWIRDLYVDYTGQPVRRGERLFTLYSPDVLATQNELLLALESRDRMQHSQVADIHEYADRLVEAARQRLELWDVSAAEIATLERTRQPILEFLLGPAACDD